ncbi:hypothetical protein PR202_ga20126 [Eleusine coracana subsp. coracana]|uniref:Uncharacterized protein n=1 Tax=Eleusine coracana subsp. coracana TaxID=191504 RepID=A0AAV5CXN5_ELECO|nr:hypothetical protein PR202_ga20126 [Eleusine coracana subsp. coracana]
MKSAKCDAYCKYDNHVLSMFTSLMFLAGILSSLVEDSRLLSTRRRVCRLRLCGRCGQDIGTGDGSLVMLSRTVR